MSYEAIRQKALDDGADPQVLDITDAVINAVADALPEFVDRRIASHAATDVQEHSEMEKRLWALEEGRRQDQIHIRQLEEELADALKFRGVYDSEKVYQPNDLVQRSGTVFVAKQVSRGAVPGASDAWKQLVKHAKPVEPEKHQLRGEAHGKVSLVGSM